MAAPTRRRGDASWIRDSYARTEFELEQWGLWSRSRLGSTISPMAILMMRMRGSTVPSPMISDERAAEIDSAVIKLRDFDRQMGEAVWLTFVERYTVRVVSAGIGCSVNTLRYRLLPDCIRWIEAELMPAPPVPPAKPDPVTEEIQSLLQEIAERPIQPTEAQAIARYLRSEPVVREIRELLRGIRLPN